MSKLCKCSKSFIRSLFMSTIRDAYESADSGYMWPLDELNYSTKKVDEASRFLESDCVCEKNEAAEVLKNLIEAEEATMKRLQTAINNAEEVIKSLEEKQSQSLCEHVGHIIYVKTEQGIEEGCLHRLYACLKCGLVTCKNPNE